MRAWIKYPLLVKIVSLIPSGTDIAAALGLGAQLRGVSHECDHACAAGLPVVTRSIIDSTLAPAQIDADVNNAVAAGQSLYLTDRELLRELAPNVVLTQTICDVCAVNSQTASRDLPPGAQLINLSAISIGGLWDDIGAVAAATGTDGKPLIARLQARLNEVRARVARVTRPRALVLEWSDPPFLGGHWVPEMIEIAGATHVLSGPCEPSRRATWDEIAAAKPEIILMAPCGYDLAQTREQGRKLLPKLQALGAQQVWATDATALFSRCTPATIRGVEVLAGIFHGAFEVEASEAQQI